MIKNKTIEICCGSIEDCAVAEMFPVDRIELNSAIELGGLTPSLGTLIESKKVTKLPICCMVRPRTAGFVYTEKQFQSMLFDAELLLKHGADGIVFGFLNEDGTIDINRTKQMSA
ncbi:MAG: copper homeostasis protein CutC, partial [Erysipelotrichaceae bacterium]|nr:copper homeostasis protein CutC [Erysipelotrichaceae bacterium]